MIIVLGKSHTIAPSEGVIVASEMRLLALGMLKKCTVHTIILVSSLVVTKRKSSTGLQALNLDRRLIPTVARSANPSWINI